MNPEQTPAPQPPAAQPDTSGVVPEPSATPDVPVTVVKAKRKLSLPKGPAPAVTIAIIVFVILAALAYMAYSSSK